MRHSIRSQIFTGDHHNLLIVGTDGDEGQSHEEVLKIHDAKLAAMGTDSLTRAAIDAYRKKHFGTADPAVPGSVQSKQSPVVAEAETAPQSPPLQKAPSAEEQAKAAVAQAIKPAAPTPAPGAPSATGTSVPAAPRAPATAPPDTPVQLLDGSGFCEECGVPISESQAKLSRLFLNRALCKVCMEAVQK